MEKNKKYFLFSPSIFTVNRILSDKPVSVWLGKLRKYSNLTVKFFIKTRIFPFTAIMTRVTIHIRLLTYANAKQTYLNGFVIFLHGILLLYLIRAKLLLWLLLFCTATLDKIHVGRLINATTTIVPDIINLKNSNVFNWKTRRSHTLNNISLCVKYTKIFRF